MVFILILNSAFEEYFRILTFLCMTVWQRICVKCTRFSCHFRSHVISPGIVLNLPRLTFDSCVLPIHFCLFVKIPNSSCLLPTVIIRFQSQPPVIDNGPGHQQWVSFCAKQDTQPIICWWDFTSVRYQNSPRPSERLNVSLLAGMYSSPASIFTVNAVPPGPDLFITAFRDELMDAAGPYRHLASVWRGKYEWGLLACAWQTLGEAQNVFWHWY